MNWNKKKVLVTGGASFIGSHLCEELVSKGANVRIADDFSSGKRENLSKIESEIEIMEGNLKKWSFTNRATEDIDVVFHLAADHGGRGYISTHPASCATNMALQNIVFENAVKNGVEKITYASSACTYPTDIQEGKKRLREDMISFDERGGAFSDEEYGWAKLMGEMSLRAFHKEYGIDAASVRIFTAYGPRENETHAIIALIAKAFVQQDPFEIWGDGEQTRNFTYVKDIVNGLILASENINDGSAVNAGTPDFISLNEAAEETFNLLDWEPKEINYLEDKPVGVRHRAADISRAKHKTGWEPEYSFKEGLSKTIDWYVKNKDRNSVQEKLNELLESRIE